jgi:hypothetical protein
MEERKSTPQSPGGHNVTTFETNATVTADSELTVRVPPGIPPGEHRVVIVIDERLVETKERLPLEFPVDHYGLWPAGLSLRREDLYGAHVDE